MTIKTKTCIDGKCEDDINFIEIQSPTDGLCMNLCLSLKKKKQNPLFDILDAIDTKIGELYQHTSMEKCVRDALGDKLSNLLENEFEEKLNKYTQILTKYKALPLERKTVENLNILLEGGFLPYYLPSMPLYDKCLDNLVGYNTETSCIAFETSSLAVDECGFDVDERWVASECPKEDWMKVQHIEVETMIAQCYHLEDLPSRPLSIKQIAILDGICVESLAVILTKQNFNFTFNLKFRKHATLCVKLTFEQ